MALEWESFWKLFFGMASLHWEKTEETCFCIDFTRRQEEGKCTKQKHKQDLFRRRTQVHTRMDFPPIISSFVFFLLLFSTVFPVISASQFEDFRRLNQTFRPGEESKKMRLIRTHLMKINKPSVKSIQVRNLFWNKLKYFLMWTFILKHRKHIK